MRFSDGIILGRWYLFLNLVTKRGGWIADEDRLLLEVAHIFERRDQTGRVDRRKMKTDFFFRHKKSSAQMRSFPSFRALTGEPVNFVGDVTVVDPFRVFFKQSAENMNTLLGEIKHSRNFVLTYREYETVFVASPAASRFNLFRLFRNGKEVGKMVNLQADPPEHGHCDNKCLFVAVIPDRLLYMLDQENRRKVNILTQLTARETNGYKISLNILDRVVSLPGSLPIDEKLSEDEDEADTDTNVVKPSKKKESYKRISIRGVNGCLVNSGYEGDFTITNSNDFLISII